MMRCHAAVQNAECGSFLQREIISEAEAKARYDVFKDFYNLNKANFGMLSAQKGKLRLWSVVAKSVYSSNIQYAFDIFEEKEPDLQELQLTPEKLKTDILATGSAHLPGVKFETNSAKLTASSSASLDAIITYVKNSQNAAFLIVGHTDNQGEFTYNQKLSEARANSVRQYLITNGGIDANRLNALGVAYASPRATNQTPEGRARNRRVELVLASPD